MPPQEISDDFDLAWTFGQAKRYHLDTVVKVRLKQSIKLAVIIMSLKGPHTDSKTKLLHVGTFARRNYR